VGHGPGIGRRVAEMIRADVGMDLHRFAREGPLSRWAQVCPGNPERAGQRSSSQTGQGRRWLRTALIQAAWAAVKGNDSQLAAVYRRLVVRRGKQKAMLAVAHRLVVASSHLLKDRVPSRESGTRPPRDQVKRKLAERMQRRLEQLGDTVRLEPAMPTTT
jgi:transposase